MQTVDHEVDRCLTLLRDRIRERGFTQLEVQETLSWGRSYISQLLTKQKKLRVEQVLQILAVIGVDPAEFFADLYGKRPRYFAQPIQSEASRPISQLREEIQTVTELLLEKKLITAEELSSAVAAAVRSGD
ncbi:MAG: helix-turn-helix transcriptional regulator [Acidobacteriota bacterium]